MKKTFSIFIIAIICAALSFAVIAEVNNSNLSELTKANIEALTDGGIITDMGGTTTIGGRKPCTGPKERDKESDLSPVMTSQPYCHCTLDTPCRDLMGCR